MPTSPSLAGSSSSGSINDGEDTVIPQNYCSKSEDELESTCATAQTCNDGDGGCPSGSFCFGNYSCLNHSSSAVPVTTLQPTTNPTVSTIAQSKPTVDVQNYCAQSAAELETSCAWAKTCNGGDGPCPSGSFCFPNAICEARQQIDSGSPTLMSTPGGHNSIDHDAAAIITDDPACDYLCLQPIDFSDCDRVFSDILPCAEFPSQVEVDEFCTGTGRCGTNLALNNCPDNKDVYVRLDSTKCVEHGLVYGSGVVPPSPRIGLEGDETDAVEASTNSSLGDNLEYGTFNGNISNSDELTGWWLKESNSARRAGGRCITQLISIALVLGLMISPFPLSW